ncbi:MAG: hypothetical protein CME63_05755 [Halobacteriovoraceae bacterium]|nr:hypothetical protein [Halobacteriovoraceae bacterium]MBC97233.1 hypothetical protein [Halobacteriovoraceae bacterium]|tara:strand:+ start:43236 stop:44681 length:1446 start_codon:yes stop_codon:yes gene_type:complete
MRNFIYKLLNQKIKRTAQVAPFLISSLLVNCSHNSEGTQPQSEKLKQESNGMVHLEVKKYTLPNGLKLLVYENHKLPIFSYYTFFDVGGRHEGKGTTGATHFLEHLMFKGAKKYGPGQFNFLIEGNGGRTNAYTNFDNTVYYEDLPIVSESQDMVEKVIDIEADRMANLALVPEAFEKERNVVLEERKMRYENRPGGKLYLAMMQAMFEGTPYGGSVIGSVEDLKSLSREHVRDYFKKFYTPDNATIVVAGDVEADEVYDMVVDKYGDMNASSKEIQKYRKSRDNPELYKHRAKYQRHIKIKGNSKNPLFMLSYPSVAMGDHKGYVLDMLSSILGSGESSFLNEKYVSNRRPILSSVSAGNYTLKYSGVFYIEGELLPKKGIYWFKNQLIKDLKKSCDTAIDARTLQKTKNQYLVSFVGGLDSNNGIAHFLGLRENFFNDYAYYKKELDIYQAITVDEVKSACKELFSSDKYIMTSVWAKH